MKFVASLIAVSDRVSQHLNASKNALLSLLPQFPAELEGTEECRWLARVKPATTTEAIDKFCTYTAEHDAERILTEGTLTQKDVAGRLASITKEKQALATVRLATSQLKEKLTHETAQIIVSANADAKQKREAAQSITASMYPRPQLSGVKYAINSSPPGLSFAQSH